MQKQLVDRDVAKQTAGLTGEQRFVVLESVYNKHGYHPIKSVVAGISVVVILPFLISVIFIFGDVGNLEAGPLKNIRFWVISDLSMQDRLLFGLNFLPVLMFVLGAGEALLRWHRQPDRLIRYFVISLLLFVLVYSLASALILYWVSMNIWAAVLYVLTTRILTDDTKPFFK